MGNTANLGVRILLEDSASLGLGNITGALGNLGISLHTVGGALGGMDNGLKALGLTAIVSGGIFAGFVSIIIGNIKAAADLGAAMANIQVSVKGASDRMDEMQRTLLDLANQSIFTAKQISDGFARMGVNGITAADIIDGRVGEAMVNLAEAIGSDTVPAAELLSFSLHTFGGTAQDAAHYADVLTGSFYNGQGTVDNLTDAIKAVAATAVAAKIPFDDLNVALDILGEAGLKGSQGGTALNYAIQQMEAPTSKAANVFQELNLIIVDKLNPNLVKLRNEMISQGGAAKSSANAFDGTYSSLNTLYNAAKKAGDVPLNQTFLQWADSTGIVTSKFYDAKTGTFNLQQAMQGLVQAILAIPADDAGARADAIRQAFGIRAAKGVNDFLALLEQTPGIWNQTWSQINTSSASGDAAIKVHTLAGEWQAFKTSIQDIQALLGKQQSGPLITLLETVDALLKKFTDASPATQGMVEKFILLGGAASGIVFALSSIGTIFGGISQLFGNSNIDKTAQALEKLGVNSHDLLQALKGMEGSGGKAFVVIKDLEDAGKSAGGPIGLLERIFGKIGGHAKDAAADLKFLVSGLGDIGKGTGLGFMKSMVQAMMGMAGATSNTSGILKVFGSPLLDIQTGFTKIGSIIPFITGDLLGMGAGLFAIIGPILLIIGVIAAVILLFTAFRKQGEQIAQFLISTFAPTFNEVKNVVQTVVGQILVTWNQIQPQLTSAMNTLVSSIKGALPFFQMIGKMIEIVAHWIGALLSGLISGFLKALPFIIGFVSAFIRILGNLAGFFQKLMHGDIGGAFGQLGALVINIGSLFKNTFGAIIAFVSTFITSIVGFFHYLWDVLFGHSIMIDVQKGFQLVFQIIGMLFNTFKAIAIDPLLTAFQVLWSGIQLGISVVMGGKGFGGLQAALLGFWNMIRDSVINPLKKGWQDFWDSVGKGVDVVIGFFDKFSTNVKNSLRSVLGPIKDVLRGLSNLPAVGGIFNGVLGILNSIHLASGGVVTRPTFAMIGEGGEPEAVIPLSKLFGFMESLQANAQAQNSNSTIYLVVDGKTITKVVHNQVTGKLQLTGAGRALN